MINCVIGVLYFSHFYADNDLFDCACSVILVGVVFWGAEVFGHLDGASHIQAVLLGSGYSIQRQSEAEDR